MYEPIYLLGRNGYILVADFRLGLPRSRLASLSLSSSGDHGYRVFWAKLILLSLGLVSNRSPTNLYSVVTLSDVRRRIYIYIYINQQGTGCAYIYIYIYIYINQQGTAEITANTACSSSLDHLQFILQVFLVGIPHRGRWSTKLQALVYDSLPTRRKVPEGNARSVVEYATL